MGKITVKHYLNTDVQKEQSRVFNFGGSGQFILNEKETSYPVYIQITVNRKTTKLKSITNRTLTKSEFTQYQKKGTYKGESSSCYCNETYYLSNELELIKDSLDYFYNRQKGDQEKFSIKDVVHFYMKDFDSTFFLEYVNSETLFIIDYDKHKYIYDVIKKDVNPLAVERFFKEQLHEDLYNVLSHSSCVNNLGDIYRSVVLFFSLMPKDKQGHVIGKAVNWFNGSLQDVFKFQLQKHGIKENLYFSLFSKLCQTWEDLNTIQKFRFAED